MLRYILHRLLMTVPTALLVALAVFVLLRLVPGDPAQLMLGDTATEEWVMSHAVGGAHA